MSTPPPAVRLVAAPLDSIFEQHWVPDGLWARVKLLALLSVVVRRNAIVFSSHLVTDLTTEWLASCAAGTRRLGPATWFNTARRWWILHVPICLQRTGVGSTVSLPRTAVPTRRRLFRFALTGNVFGMRLTERSWYDVSYPFTDAHHTTVGCNYIYINLHNITYCLRSNEVAEGYENVFCLTALLPLS